MSTVCGDRYSSCSKPGYIPAHDPWTKEVQPFAHILCDGWTLGKYMRSMIYATALHLRTSSCESFFHTVDVWRPMWAGFSPRGYLNGVRCSALTHNEQRRSKVLTSGRIGECVHVRLVTVTGALRCAWLGYVNMCRKDQVSP